MGFEFGFVSCCAAGAAAAPTSLKAIKVCGISSHQDASMICHAFREEVPEEVELLLGMILWPGSKRAVDVATARKIATTARQHGATPVGVFVDESATMIGSMCEDSDIPIAQLHGSACRESVQKNGLPGHLSVVNVVDVLADGSLGMKSSELDTLESLWQLYDYRGGGTGKQFDWSRFEPPEGKWFLAGGLDPENVDDAVTSLRPFGLDVSSGVTAIDNCTKDEQRLRRFVRNAWTASQRTSKMSSAPL